MPLRDGINYTNFYEAYADLDFIGLGGVYATPLGATPSIRLGKIRGRWVFVDSNGKVGLLRGLYAIDPNQAGVLGGGQQSGRTLTGNFNTKYGGNAATWLNATINNRLRPLHFNFAGKDSTRLNTASTANSLPLVFQFNAMVGAATASQSGPAGLSEPIKDLVQTLNFACGFLGTCFGDVFDPKWTQYCNAAWGNSTFADSRIAFFQADDGDFTSAFFTAGPPNEFGGVDWDPIAHDYRPHAGLIILLGNPTVTSQHSARFNFDVGGNFTWTIDTVNHAKLAAITYLKNKYTTIAALNAAWGTGGYYTTFDSAGGWGAGTGLSDEDGARAHRWLGSDVGPTGNQNGGPNNLIDSTLWGLQGTTVTSDFGLGTVSALKNDMDNLLYLLVQAYCQPQIARIHTLRPEALFLGSTNAAFRIPAMQAHSQYQDALMAGGHVFLGDTHTFNPNAKAFSDFVRSKVTIDKPWLVALYNPCNHDGDLHYLSGDVNDTQVNRGTKEATAIAAITGYKDPNGVYPYLGYLEWQLYTNVGEGVGWGPFSTNDNPFDGQNYTAAIPDPYTSGLTVIPEDLVYGNYVGAIKAAHIAQFSTLQSQVTAGPSKSAILAFLNNSPARTTARLISGQLTIFPDPAPTLFQQIKTASGQTPGLMGIQLGDFFTPENPANWPANQNRTSSQVTEAIAQWNAGGLVHASFLMAQPLSGDPSDNSGVGNMTNLLNGTTVCHPFVGGVQITSTFDQMLDRQLITPLQTLINAGVVVILRPFPEMNSGFWWGLANTPSADYIAMWQHIYNYVVVTKGLGANVIWLFAVIPGNGSYTNCYPGAAFVDLCGVDYYSPDGRAPLGIGGWSDLKALGKPMVFAELGHQTFGAPAANHDLNVLLGDIQTNYPEAAFFMCWTGGNDQITDASNITAALARPWVANLPLAIGATVPVASFTPTQEASSLTVDFTNTSTGSPAPSAAWTFFATDGTTVLGTSTTLNPTFAFPAAGVYPVRLVAQNSQGSNTVTNSVSVTAPVPTFSFVRELSNEIDAAGLTQITLAPLAITAGQIQLIFADIGAGPNLVFTVTDTLGHTYNPIGPRLTYTNSNAGATPSTVQAFAVLATATGSNPTVTISWTGGTTAAGTATIAKLWQASITGAAPALLVDVVVGNTGLNSTGPVDPGPILTTGGQDALIGYETWTIFRPTDPTGWTSLGPEHNPLWHRLNVPPGTYAFQLPYSGTQNWAALVVALKAPTAGISVSPAFLALQDGNSLAVHFTDLSTGAPNAWSWSVAGIGVIATTQNPTYSFPVPGVYQVTLTATNPQGSNFITQAVTVTRVTPDPAPPRPNRFLWS